MKQPRYRAWRFVHPYMPPAEEAWAPPPAETGLRISIRGRIEMMEDEASVRQAILLLLSTKPGERVMRPDYGCDLYRLVFSPNDDTTAGLAIHYVRQALNKWEPRVEIVRLDAGRNLEMPNRLDIVLDYRVRGAQRGQQITFPLDLTLERS